jgi:hypothetical protein
MRLRSLFRTGILLFSLVFGLNVFVHGQGDTSIVMGSVRDQSSYKVIPFAQVKNVMQHTRVIADAKGDYIIPICRGDLLKITAIGFEDGFYIVNDSSELIKDFPIQLKPRVYDLKEFTITPYKTVLQFKHAFAQLEIKDENPEIDLKLPQNYHHQENEFEEGLGKASFMSPISALYNAFSHQGKVARKYRLLLAQDYKTKIVRKRFNQKVVAQIVRFDTKEELNDFISFCKFDFDFLLNSTDYELIAAIQNKYMLYTQTKFP